MIRITDTTLSCLGDTIPSRSQLEKLIGLLLSTGVDIIEIPAVLYELAPPEPSNKFMIRISDIREAACYPDISRFICKRNGSSEIPQIITELQINDVKEINFLGRHGPWQNVRLTGFDDILCHDYISVFANIRKQFKGRIELCPENGFFSATSITVEWLLDEGTDIAVSFGGLGEKAALEEVLVALRTIKRYRPGASYAMFPELKLLIEEITCQRFSVRKAVIGSKIFDVESGIHIDGILKRPEMYEPFPPELVGSNRRFFIGKHSGKKAVSAKLIGLGLNPDEYDRASLLDEIRYLSTEKMSSLTDEELFNIAPKHKSR